MARARAILEVEASKTDKFVSAVLTQASQDALLEAFPPVHPNVYGHHMTMAFKPSNAALERYEPMLGERLQLRVVGYAEDESGQAVVVDGLSENLKPHITVSTADGVGPVYSNKLLEHGYEPVDGPELEALVEIENLEEAEDPRNVLGKLARGSRFVPEPLDWLEIERLVDIIAMGPLRRLPSDEKLVQRGYVEPYDDDQEALVAAHGLPDALYDKNGSIRKEWIHGSIRKEWIKQSSLHRYEAKETPKRVLQAMRNPSDVRAQLFQAASEMAKNGLHQSAYFLNALGMMVGGKHPKLASGVDRLPDLAKRWSEKGFEQAAQAAMAAYAYEIARRHVSEARENPKSVRRRIRSQDAQAARSELFRAAASLRNVGMDAEADMFDTLGTVLGLNDKNLADIVPKLPSLASVFRSKGLYTSADALVAAYEYEMSRREVAEAEDPRSVMRGFRRPTYSSIVSRLRAAATWLLMNDYVGEGRYIKALRYQVGIETGENLRPVDADRAELLREGDRLARALGDMGQVEPARADAFNSIRQALEDALHFLRQRRS
jgi:hypothetical protein